MLIIGIHFYNQSPLANEQLKHMPTCFLHKPGHTNERFVYINEFHKKSITTAI